MGTNPQACPETLANVEDAIMVEDAMLVSGRSSRGQLQEGVPAAGNILGESAILALLQMFPIKRTEHQQPQMTSFNATSAATLSPKIMVREMPLLWPSQSNDSGGNATSIECKWHSSKCDTGNGKQILGN